MHITFSRKKDLGGELSTWTTPISHARAPGPAAACLSMLPYVPICASRPTSTKCSRQAPLLVHATCALASAAHHAPAWRHCPNSRLPSWPRVSVAEPMYQSYYSHVFEKGSKICYRHVSGAWVSS